MINQLYSNVYLGDSSIHRIYRGDSLIYIENTPDILLEYIANGADTNSTVNVGFDTSVNVINTPFMKIEAKVSMYRKTSVNVLGAVRKNSWDGIAMYLYRNSTQVASCRFNNTVVDSSVSVNLNTPTTMTMYYDTSEVDPSNNNKYKCKFIVDGNTYTSDSYIAYPTRDFNIIISGQNTMESTDNTVSLNTNPSGLKTYYVKIWSSDNLIRFYIPVLHYINGQYTPCFYDKVNNSYIYNLGTDTPVYSFQK